MVTTTAWIPAQKPYLGQDYISGTSTIDAGETASLTIPCHGKAVIFIGVPTITSANLTFTVQPYAGATFRTLKDSAGNTVTKTTGTGALVVSVPELSGCFAFTIVSTQTQVGARAFQVDMVGTNALQGISVPSLNVQTSQYQQVPQAFADVTAGAKAWTTAHSPITIYTVTGTVLARVFGVVGATPLTSTANTGTAAVGVTGATGAFLAATTINGSTNFVASAAWVDSTPTVTAEALASSSGWTLCTGNIILTIATNNATAGAITLYCQYIPVTTDGLVVAA